MNSTAVLQNFSTPEFHPRAKSVTSTPDVSGTQKTIVPIIVNDAVYTGCGYISIVLQVLAPFLTRRTNRFAFCNGCFVSNVDSFKLLRHCKANPVNPDVKNEGGKNAQCNGAK